MARSRVTGGQKLKRFIAQAKRAQAGAVGGVEVGFFETARYPPVSTGKGGGRRQKTLPVATVAAWNEFGNRAGVPERPYFRNALDASKGDVNAVIKESIDPRTMAPDKALAGKVGLVVQGHIQRSITSLRTPPNAPSVIKRKGSSNPLIDTKKMTNSVTFKVK